MIEKKRGTDFYTCLKFRCLLCGIYYLFWTFKKRFYFNIYFFKKQAYRSNNNYPNQQFGYYNHYQHSPGAPLNPISVESVQENKENSLSDLDSEASLICQAKSDAELNESSTNSATPGLSSNSVLSISPLSSSSCSSTSASNSSSSHCSISNTFKTDDFNSKNQQNLHLNQSVSQQAITTNRSKENKLFGMYEYFLLI